MKSTLFLTIVSLLVCGCSPTAPNVNSNIVNKAAVAVPSPQATPTATATGSNAPQTPSAEAAGVTLANFDKLRKGMTVEEIKKTIGSDGKVISESQTPGYKMSMYQWKKGAANISCMFQNDKMISKTQFGL